MKTETHVGNALLFANSVLVISLFTDVGGMWWWIWLGGGFVMIAARIARNFIPGFWVYHVCNYGEQDAIRTEGFHSPNQEKYIADNIKCIDPELLTQQGEDVVSFTLGRSRPVLRTRRYTNPGQPLVGFWLWVDSPVRVVRSHMMFAHSLGLHRDFGQIAEVVVPRDQIDYGSWSYTDPRTYWDRCVTALVWVSSWYEDVDQIKKTVVVWKAALIPCRKAFVESYHRVYAKMVARKAR